MSTDDFDEMFGARPAARKSFAERVGGSLPPLGDTTPTEELGTYKAFGFMPNGVCEGCDVQRWMDGTTIAEGIEFQFRFLLQIGYVGEEQLKLFLPDCIIVIDGRHLRELRKKLARRQVTFIQQYSTRIWAAPDTNDAFIDRIEVLRP